MRVGLDVGGTKTVAVAVDGGDRVVGHVRRATGFGPDAVVAGIVDAVDALAAELGVSRARIGSVGVGIPGQIEPGSGRVRHALNLGIGDLEMASALTSLLGAPVQVENDVKAAAVGAYSLHGGTGTMAYLNLGTGIAAAIVSEGVLWRGPRGAAGEIGHISVDPSGPFCRCGQRGCIEALAGGGAVAAHWGRGGALPVLDVFDAADAGDPDAIALRSGIHRGIAAAVQVLVLTTDVDAVVIGGGLTALGDRLLAPVRAELSARSAASDFLRSLQLAERILPLPAGSHAAALGAALIGAEAEGVLARG